MEMGRIRELVKAAYKRPRWYKRVDLMDDDQVLAIYKTLKQQKKV